MGANGRVLPRRDSLSAYLHYHLRGILAVRPQRGLPLPLHGMHHGRPDGVCRIPSLNQFIPTDIAWAFALYLEAVAAMPQLFLFRKTNRVQPFISHFLAGQVTSKAFALMFWVSSYHELSDRGSRIYT